MGKFRPSEYKKLFITIVQNGEILYSKDMVLDPGHDKEVLNLVSTTIEDWEKVRDEKDKADKG